MKKNEATELAKKMSNKLNGTYYLSHGEYGRPVYTAKYNRKTKTYGVWVSPQYYLGTIGAPTAHWLDDWSA